MKKKVITIEMLYPEDGCYLTQRNRTEEEQPIMSLEVINGKEEEWVNIPIAEGDAILLRWEVEQEVKARQAELERPR